MIVAGYKIFFFHKNRIPLLSKNIFVKNNKALYEGDELKSKIEELKMLTNNNKTKYERIEKCLMKNPDEELCIYQFLCPKEVLNKKKVIYGDNLDGTYILHDDLENIKIAYSLGIDSRIQFDKALADKGIDVYMYDHTINKLPFENEKFHWKKIGIGGNKNRTYNIQTLQEMLKENGHVNEKNMILKIDVEGAEWDSLADTPEDVLLQFKYITIEYHFFEIFHPYFYDVIKKVHKTHQVFFVQCHPPSPAITYENNIICECLEVSYIIREGNKFSTDKSIYPVEGLNKEFNANFNVNILKLFDKYDK